MARLINRWSVLMWVVALITTAVIVIVVVTDGAAPGTATSTPQSRADGGGGRTLPVGSVLPSAGQCAEFANQVGLDRETVPENWAANMSVPQDLRLPAWPGFWDPAANQLFVPRIDGQFTGTTDQIIVWGACKWGIETDVVRAMAVAESSWRQDKVSDFVTDPALCVDGYVVPCPTSFGLLQLKHTTRPGSWPDSQRDTAFNVDYSLAVLRGCMEGWVTYLGNGYTAGDLWGCVGWHYSGEWKDGLALKYVQTVQHWLAERPWTSW
jgi:hypothetical protein